MLGMAVVLCLAGGAAWRWRRARFDWGGPATGLVLGLGLAGAVALDPTGPGHASGALHQTLAAGAVALVVWALADELFRRVIPGGHARRWLVHAGLTGVLFALAALYPFPFPSAQEGRTTVAVAVAGSPVEASDISHEFAWVGERMGLSDIRVRVVPDPAPEAAITLRFWGRAKVGVTTGLAEILNRDELAFIIAHELEHHRRHHVARRALLAAAALTLFGGGVHLALGGPWAPPVPAPHEGGGELGVFLRRAPGYALLAVCLTLGVLAVFRHQETAADLGAVSALGSTDAAIDALEKVGERFPELNHRPRATCWYAHPTLERRTRDLAAAARGGQER